METFSTNSFIFWAAYTASNLVAASLIWSSIRYPGHTRAIFSLIFIGAAAANAYIAIDSPWAYQDYADTAIPLYKKFILGIFEAIITPMVLTIAFAQLAIAISMLFRGKPLIAGCWAGIVFGISIAPLGLYAAFPSTILMAIALFRLQKNEQNTLVYDTPAKQTGASSTVLK